MPIPSERPEISHTPELARARYRIARGAGHEHVCAIEFGRSDALSLRDACVCMGTLVRVARLRHALRRSGKLRGPSMATRLARQLA